MIPPVQDGLDRLGSFIALLPSEDGEAENAGRAAGQLARRLGLSGGQLKAIFLAGVRAAGVPMPPPAPDPSEALAERADRLEREIQDLRRLLDASDDGLHAANLAAARLRDENEDLRDALDGARTTASVLRIAGLVLVLALLGGGAVAVWAPDWVPHRQTPPAGSPLQRMGLAGPGGVALYAQPDLAAASLGRLPGGARLPVRQILWRGFSQWVETEHQGQPAYAPATQVDLR